MSTRQYQIYADLAIARDVAEQKMKDARKQFIEHIRNTGTELRKIFVKEVRDSLASISTRTVDWSEGTTLTGAMEVTIGSGAHHGLNPFEIQEIKDYLLSQGWAFKESNVHKGRACEYQIFICI